jgi:hypothetical protein
MKNSSFVRGADPIESTQGYPADGATSTVFENYLGFCVRIGDQPIQLGRFA